MSAKEEFIERWSLVLEGLLLRGYVYPNCEAGMRYRTMENDHKRLLAFMDKMYEELTAPKVPKKG